MIRTVMSSFRKLTYSTFVFHIAEIHIQSWVLQSDSKIKWRMMSKYFIMKTAQRPVIYCSLAGKRKLSFHNSLWWCDSAIPPLIVIISIAGLTNRCLVEASMLMCQKGKLTWDTLVRTPQVPDVVSSSSFSTQSESQANMCPPEDDCKNVRRITTVWILMLCFV